MDQATSENVATGGAVNDLVERVARAICRVQQIDPDQMGPGERHAILTDDGITHILCDHRGPLWKMWVPLARAAIEAMREPTDKMLVAGLIAGNQSNKPAVERMKTLGDNSWIAADIATGDGRIYKAAYSAMITAALKEPAGGVG